MPAIAIVAAVGTVSAGAALGGVLGGIMVAGGVMSGLGAVTGNKELSKWGAIASLGAGIGAAAGLANSANSMWNSAVGADSALSVTGNSFLDAGGSMAGIGEAVGWKGATPVPTTQANTPGLTATQGNAANQLDPLSHGLSGPARTEGLRAAGGEGFNLSAAAQEPSLIASRSGMVSANNLPTTGGQFSLAGNAGAVDATTGVGGSFIDKSLSFIKQNPEASKIGAGLVGGAMTSYSKQREQEAALQAQADARARYNASITGQGWSPTPRRG